MRGSMHKGINCRDAASIVDGEFSPCGCGLWPRAVLAGEYDTRYTVNTKYTVLCIVYCVLLYTTQYTYADYIWTDQTKDCARAAWEDLGSINSTSISMRSHLIIESSISVDTSETELVPLVLHGSSTYILVQRVPL